MYTFILQIWKLSSLVSNSLPAELFGKRSTDAVLESINFRFSTAKNNSIYCRVSLNC